MLRSLKDLERYAVNATDGHIGHIVNFLFDNEKWAVRYLVAQTSDVFEGDSVLISPISFREIDWDALRFQLALTQDQVRQSPSFDLDRPPCRQHEQDYCQYYGYTPYWGHSGLWGTGTDPSRLARNSLPESVARYSDKFGDVRLHAASEIRECHVQGRGEPIGQIEDLIVDDQTWEVRYLVVDTSNWWFGEHVLVAQRWAYRINWEDEKVYVDLSRETIQHSPRWDASKTVNREYEIRLYDYYGSPQYWENGERPMVAPAAMHSANQAL